MKEFIFTWNIENISHCWHKKGEKIESPPFLADTLQNTVWKLSFYPRGNSNDYWLSLYLHSDGDEGPIDFLVDFELSCVSANNFKLTSHDNKQINASSAGGCGIGNNKFLKRREVFVSKKDLYITQDTLKLRCRLWKREGVDEFGQCFGSTRLDIERTISVQVMDLVTSTEKTIMLHSERQKTLLISIDVQQQKGGLNISLHPNKSSNLKFSTFRFFAEGKNRKPFEFVTSWFVRPYRKVWRIPFSNIKELTELENELKLTCEFIYPTGIDTNSIEKVSPCSFKFPEFPSNCILCCISSGRLSDCPNICRDLWDLYEKQILCDVELKTQTTSFWVHKTVLSARSPVFSAMFTNVMRARLTNCVEMEDLEDDTLEKLLKFLYTDSFEETQWDAVMKLYYSADKYQVALLKNLCSSYFMNKIDTFKVGELLILAYKHNDNDLKSRVEDYVVMSPEKIFSSPMWKQFTEKHPIMAAKTMLRKGKKREKENPVEAPKLSSYPNAMDDLKSIYHSQIGSDIVVVQTPTSTFPAHKTILCAGSLTLKKMFSSGLLIDSLKIKDLEDDTVFRLLRFLYTDSLGDIKLETATRLYKAAVSYQIERLRIYCLCFFLENLDASNASSLSQLANAHRDIKLKSLVGDFICQPNCKRSTNKVSEKFGETNPAERIETTPSKRLRLN